MIIPVPAPLPVRMVTTAGSTLASRSRIWLPVISGGALLPELEAEDEVTPGTLWTTFLVLVPRVATATPPPTSAPIRAAISATSQTEGRPDLGLGGGGGGGAGGPHGLPPAGCDPGQVGWS